jgi:hypothetical protein
MRLTRKPSEQSAIDALVKYLDDQNIPTEIDPDIQDAPECVLINAKGRIACECRYLGPEGLLQFHGRRLVRNKMYEVALPWEPHIWVSRAIEAKLGKIDQYIQNSKADSASLLLHSSPFLPLLNHRSGLALQYMQQGARNVEHNFSNIWLVDSIQNNCTVVDLWDSQIDTYDPTNIEINDDIYPIGRMWIGKLEAMDDGNGRTVARANLKNVAERIQLQPLDGRYRVRYEGDWNNISARIQREL